MQKSTMYAALSVVCASTLLVGPFSTAHTLWNMEQGLGKRGQQQRLNTQSAVRRRVAICEESDIMYRSFVATPPASTCPLDMSCSADVPAAIPAPMSGGFLMEEYKNAGEEIRARIGQEEILFGLKFTLIGGIMAVLFSLIRKEERDFFEKLVQKRRAAAFFSAALLTGVIVDTRLRFNAHIIESRGDWIFCIERVVAQSGASGRVVPWEGFLHFSMDAGSNPLMRHASHLLTSLLYGVAVYLFIVMPRTVNRSTRAMLTHSAAVFFLILIWISLSYDCPYGSRWALFGAIATILVGAAGMVFLCEAYRARFATSNACRLTESIVKDAQRRALHGRPAAKRRARLLRATYEAAARLLEPAQFAVEMSKKFEASPRRKLPSLSKLKIDAVDWRVAAAMAKKWRRASREAEGLSRVKASGKLNRKAARWRLALWGRRTWFAINARYFEWRIARVLRPSNEAAHAAEESLWEVYFQDFVQKNAIRPLVRRELSRVRLASNPDGPVALAMGETTTGQHTQARMPGSRLRPAQRRPGAAREGQG